MNKKRSDYLERTAVILDFNCKFKSEFCSQNYDIYLLDRYHGIIANISTNKANTLLNDIENEITFKDFYKLIASNYKEIFCLFLSYDYLNIDDYLVNKALNHSRKRNEARIYTYLLNYKNQNKQLIVNNVLEMVEKGYELKDIIVRIQQISLKETFSLNDTIANYITCLM
jgi:hypothetical protein